MKKEREAEIALKREGRGELKAMQLLKAADMGVEVDKETGAALVDGSGRREVRATTTTTTSNNGKNVDVEEPPKAYVPPPEDSDMKRW